MQALDTKTITEIHRKLAPSEHAFNVIYEHCQIIAEIAQQLIETNSLKLDENLVYAAAMLHDIGYYSLYDDSGFVPEAKAIQHGVTGASLLRKDGVPEAVCRIAERHTGMGLTREDIQKRRLPLPSRDLIAETPEEKLVMYADKFHTKSVLIDEPYDTRGWFNKTSTYLAIVKRFGEALGKRFEKFVEEYGEPDLTNLAKKYNQPIR
jgi:uncharacterized protein